MSNTLFVSLLGCGSSLFVAPQRLFKGLSSCIPLMLTSHLLAFELKAEEKDILWCFDEQSGTGTWGLRLWLSLVFLMFLEVKWDLARIPTLPRGKERFHFSWSLSHLYWASGYNPPLSPSPIILMLWFPSRNTGHESGQHFVRGCHFPSPAVVGFHQCPQAVDFVDFHWKVRLLSTFHRGYGAVHGVSGVATVYFPWPAPPGNFCKVLPNLPYEPLVGFLVGKTYIRVWTFQCLQCPGLHTFTLAHTQPLAIHQKYLLIFLPNCPG